MRMNELNRELGSLQESMLDACKRCRAALEEKCPPLGFGTAGDAAQIACETRIKAIDDFCAEIQKLEGEDTIKRAEEMLHSRHDRG